jgi:hypothetical protein
MRRILLGLSLALVALPITGQMALAEILSLSCNRIIYYDTSGNPGGPRSIHIDYWIDLDHSTAIWRWVGQNTDGSDYIGRVTDPVTVSPEEIVIGTDTINRVTGQAIAYAKMAVMMRMTCVKANEPIPSGFSLTPQF